MIASAHGQAKRLRAELDRLDRLLDEQGEELTSVEVARVIVHLDQAADRVERLVNGLEEHLVPDLEELCDG